MKFNKFNIKIIYKVKDNSNNLKYNRLIVIYLNFK